MAINQTRDTKHLQWNTAFTAQRNAQFERMQKYIDSEVLRLNDPLIPKDTVALILSGQTGTKIGSGVVKYVAPYASTQYYDTADTRSYDSRRGAHWFERMKVAHKQGILERAKKV